MKRRLLQTEFPVVHGTRKIRCLQCPEIPQKPFADRADGKPVHTGWMSRLRAPDEPETHKFFHLAEWKFQLLHFLMKRRRQRLVRIRYHC